MLNTRFFQRAVVAILGKQLIAKYALDAGKDPQHYGIGIKELWKIPAEQHQARPSGS